MKTKDELLVERSDLPALKEALFRKRLQNALQGGSEMTRPERPTIPRRAPSNHAPLSFAQERLWFLNQLDPDSSVYNTYQAVRLTGALDVEALEKSFSEIVRRHEALRTVFTSVDGNPAQVVTAPRPVVLTKFDLSSRPKTERDTEAQRLLNGEFRKPFDLSSDLLIRAALVRLSAKEHLLLITHHHIASDGWSLGVLSRELATFYDSFTKGKTASLPELPIQYVDFAVWQREWLQGENLESRLAYWRKQLGGNLPVLELPTDHPRPAVQSLRGDTRSMPLPESLRRALENLSQREGVTLFMTLLAAFKALLHRYTSQEDLLIGTPVASRNQVETEGLIGFFINTLVMRTDLSGNLTFRELLHRVRETVLGAFSHQELPFEKLVAELHAERSLSHNPLFQVMFVLQSAPLELTELPGLRVSPIEVSGGTAMFDLTLMVTDEKRGSTVSIEYNTDLFDAETISRMLGHFQILLGSITKNPELRLGELPLLSAAERHQLLDEWNDTATDYERDACVHELFEAQVQKTPDAMALVFEGRELTYRELNERANQLARRLQKAGVGSETLVGLSVERSPELIISLLAILKAGGAYVPLDRSYPKARLAQMLEAARVPVLLTDGNFDQTNLPAHQPPRLLRLEEEWVNLSQENKANLPHQVNAQSLAYVNFTSGSTGKPKAVAVPHRGIVRLVRNTNYAQFSANEVFLHLSPISFDASTFEIWGALLNGARLAVFPPELPGLEQLGTTIREQGITTLWLTAGLFHQMVEHQIESLRGVRQLLAGGDVLSVSHVLKALKELPDTQIINGYGPTENTTFTCCYRVPADWAGGCSLPIGRPISNTQVYVLDEQLEPVPIGVAGELYAGGAGLAREYLNDPELTRQKFIASPFRNSSERLYKTGDRVRWLADGNLEFLGRLDEQVKIRGFRVELAEIETMLARHEAVRECVVSACAESSDQKKLVAYFVGDNNNGHPTAEELRRFLTGKLPDYMVPSAFVRLKALPLTANKKVDRRALPPPEPKRPPLETKHIAPRDAVEQQLAKIWETVLSVQPISVTDKFFDLGGHSLLAVRLAAQIEKTFDQKIPVATIFHAPTIEQLARILWREGDNTSGLPLIEIQSKGTRPPLFLVHGAGGGMFWGYNNLARALGDDQPVYVLKSRGMDDQEEFSTIEEMADHYVQAIRAAQPHGPYFLGGYCFGGNVAYEIARLLFVQGEKVALLAVLNCAPPGSAYGHMRWTPDWLLQFFKNLGYWIQYVVQWNPQHRREFVRWKLGALKKKLLRTFKFSDSVALNADVGDLVDLSWYPEERRKLWETHIHALMNYRPQAFPGRVTLFRNRGHPLICSFDPECGWAALARGGVAVKVVPGAHESILQEPHVCVLAEELTRCLLEAQQETSDSMIQGRGRERADHRNQIIVRQGKNRAPVSFAQQRLWFLDHFENKNSAYNRCVALQLRGPLDVRALERSLTEVVRRHEILRTSFPSENGQPTQSVGSASALDLPLTDLCHLPLAECEAKARQLVEAERARSFDLAQGPMLRVALLQPGGSEHWLVLTLHEIVADDLSVEIFVKELNTLYDCFASARPSWLPELPIQFADLVQWQRDSLGDASIEPHLSFWKSQLNGAPALLELPTDHPRPAAQSYRAATQACELSKDLVEALRSRSQGEGVSEFTILLGTFQALISRYTGQTDIVIGTPVPNRTPPEVEGLIGCFANLLVLRGDLSGDPTFRELLARTHTITTEAHAHQDVPFEKLVEELKPARDQSYHPLVQVMLNFRPARMTTVECAGLTIDRLDLATATTKLDLVLNLTETAAGLRAEIEYATDVFEADTIQRMLGHWQMLLRGAVTNPDQRLSELQLLTTAEEDQVLVEWNHTASSYPRDATLVELFEAQVARTPDTTALVFAGESLTYRELNARANQLAHHLRTLGVGPEVLAGICVERSAQMIVGILGILKAGGAYVPMDPAYPKDRLAFMLEDARAPVLVTQQSLLSLFPDVTALSIRNPAIVCLDSDWEEIETASKENPRSGVQAHNLAYVIYTSGSTGKPKGVALEHRSVVALTHWAKQIFSADELAGVLASTSICFDLSVFEMFVPLALGGKIILAENALQLPALAASQDVTLVNTVPSAMKELLRIDGVPPCVRVINLAGEPLSTALVNQIYEQTAVQKVYDLYGPTETTVYSTFALRRATEPPTIGRPLANEKIFLLDAHGQPVPVGVPGEIYIGGDGLARGYLHRPELTAERFVPDPFSGKPGARLYRTGDLARFRRDGNIEFLGRIDHQVKIRGFRIELGEIESALRQHGNIREAIVLAREDQPGVKRLVAYFVPKPDTSIANDELRVFLKERLPDYMVPSAFVPLDALPLTPNGKVDRKALPAPDQARPELAGGYVAPRTPTEEVLVGVWCDVLGLKQVGIEDNFFDLGGNSLLAIQVISRMREAFQVEVSLASLFETSTIAALAEGLATARFGTEKTPAPPLLPVARDRNLPLSFSQQRLWFIDQLEPANFAYNIPTAVRLDGTLDVAALREGLNEIVRRHEILRTTFSAPDAEPVQIILPTLSLALPVIDLRDRSDSERESETQRLITEEAQRPFDLARGQLIRCTLLHVAERQHVLAVIMHHTISDGWSLGVFFHELQTLYASAVAKKPARLPELPVQYADFAVWQREWLQDDVLEKHVAYWKQKLAGAPPSLNLPTDQRDSAPSAFRGAQHSVALPEPLREAVLAANRRYGSTSFMVLLAALLIALKKWTRQSDLVVGTVVAGRTRRETENLIGCFMNFLPLRLKVADGETALDLLSRVKSEVLEAHAHQDCPFEKIVEAVNPDRHLHQNPIYNVALLLQNYSSTAFATPELTGTFITAETEAALLDLRFVAEETEQGMTVKCEYRKDLFQPQTIEHLLTAFCQALETLTERLQTQLTEFALPQELHHQAEGSRAHKEEPVIAIAATFTAEPLEEPLRFWMNELEQSVEIKFASYNQVFQQLLDPASLLATNARGLNVILVRVEDWNRAEAGKTGAAASDSSAERNAREFISALKAAAGRTAAPYLVCLCPASRGSKLEKFFHGIEQMIVADFIRVPSVHVITPEELLECYPVAEPFDELGDELGHVPYTPTFFAALGTMIARKFHALKRPACKVIALDCDQTLWAGVCGEEGPKGIILDPPRRALQEFMRAQLDAGMLLCLCSKNNEEDVAAVFEQRSEMPLRREHFAAARLNWRPKSENLQGLAEELRLGLDSFVFVDDNPVECAEVEANCPEVLTLRLPESPELIPQFLKHCWMFDHLKQTAEDKQRTSFYQQDRQREQLREESPSLVDFLARLNLQIQIGGLLPEQFSRVAQLTQRTNQFNCTTRRRTEAEIQKLQQSEDFEALTVSVSDRFGDYGLVGVVIYKVENRTLAVDTFLLSCRVLGRGVEHRVLAQLGALGRKRGAEVIDVHFVPSAKNKPALDFLESVGAPFQQALNGGYVFRFPTEIAAAIAFNPQRETRTDSSPTVVEHHLAQAADRNRFSRYLEIALEANDVGKILHAIEAKADRRRGSGQTYTAPGTEVERQLCQIWERLLHVERVGIEDDFFELGGHSLLAVRLFGEVQKLTGKKLPLITLFQAPTITQLAKVLGEASSHSTVVPIQAQGSQPPLFLVHGAGGDVLWGYANLAPHLGAEQPVYGIQSRAQVGLEEFNRLEDMAAHYIKDLRTFQPTGPYYLGGYCFGGNVAYEMARQLQAQGETVRLLALLDTAPSNGSYERITWWHPSFVFKFSRNLYFWLEDFLKLKSSDRRNFFVRKLRALRKKIFRRFSRSSSGQMPIDLDEFLDVTQFSDHELKLWQIHLRLLTEHVSQPYSGHVTLLRTRGHPLLCSFEYDFGWSKLARGGVTVTVIPGSHENVFMEPNVRFLAQELETILTAARQQSKPRELQVL